MSTHNSASHTSSSSVLPLPIEEVGDAEVRDYLDQYAERLVGFPAEQASLLIRLAIWLAEQAPERFGSLPEETIPALCDLLDPKELHRPLSWHLRSAWHREWLASGRRPTTDMHQWLPEAGGFPLPAARLARPPSRDHIEELWQGLAGEDAIGFWLHNLPSLNEDLGDKEIGPVIRARVLEEIARHAVEGVVGPDSVPRRTFEFYSSWALDNPRGLAALLGRVRALPMMLVWQHPEGPGGRIRLDVPSGLDVPLRLDVTGLFRDKLWLAGWSTTPLLNALRAQPALRAGLASRIGAEGYDGALADLTHDERIQVLAMDPVLLAAGAPGGRRNGQATDKPPAWLRGQDLLLPAIGRIERDDHGYVRAWLYAAVDTEAALPLLDARLTAGVRDGRLPIWGLVVEHVQTRSALEWVGHLQEPRTWHGALCYSPRFRTALELQPELLRKRAGEHGLVVLDILVAAAARTSAALPLARRVLTGWEGAVDLVRARPVEDFGETDESGVGILALVGTAEALDLAAEKAAEIARVRGLDQPNRTPDELLVRLLVGLPWLPAGLVERLAPRLGASGLFEVLREGDLAGIPVRAIAERLGQDGQMPGSFYVGPSVATLLRVACGELPESALVGLDWGSEPLVSASQEERLTLRLLAGLGAGGLRWTLLSEWLTTAETNWERQQLLDAARQNGAPETSLEDLCRRILRFATAISAPPLPEPDTTTLPDVDLADLARPLCEAFVATWPVGPGPRDRVLRAVQLSGVRRLSRALDQAGLDTDARNAFLAALGEEWPDRGRLDVLLADMPGKDAILDRCGEEHGPFLVRASLRALIAGAQPGWASGGSAATTLLDTMTSGPWSSAAASLARALWDVLNDADLCAAVGPERRAWLRGALYALGKLREPVGGKVPGLLRKLAKDLPEPLRTVAEGQAELFHRENLAIQRRRPAADRVRQAVLTLREADRQTVVPVVVTRSG